MGDCSPAPRMKQPATLLTVMKFPPPTGIGTAFSIGGSTLFSLRLANNICSFSTPITFANGSAFDRQLAILSVWRGGKSEGLKDYNETSKYVTSRECTSFRGGFML